MVPAARSATQQQVVVDSVLRLFPESFDAHVHHGVPAAGAELIAELVDIADGIAVVDAHHWDKQPDWTYDAVDSGQAPADRR